MGEQESAVVVRLPQIMLGKDRVDAVVGIARQVAKIGAGAQAPNTRPKIVSIRFR